MYADRSASGRIRALKAITLATYHANNPTKNDFGGLKSSDALTVLLRHAGTVAQCGKCCEPVCQIPIGVIFPFTPADTPDDSIPSIPELEGILFDITGSTITIPAPPAGYPNDRYGFFVFFPEMCNASTYTISVSDDSGVVNQVQYFLGTYNAPIFEPEYPKTGFIVGYPSRDPLTNVNGTITASNECSQTTSSLEYGCFLEGAQVAMADGTFKAIETVAVGDSVRGAFGESNVVTALHRPLLGAGGIVNVNGEHKTTTHHPHVGANKQFYCVAPDIINGFTYGKEHTVIVNNSGKKEKRLMKGLKPERIAKLEVGVELQTLGGAKRVDTLEKIPMSPFTQVYHLAVDGSHTFVVNGYAVTGWPNEDDFDYDAWNSK